jgi:hypothetical protein
MKTVLFIEYFVYPSAAISAKRIGKFCKYLADDVSSVILTAKEEYYETLDNELKLTRGKIYRTRLFTANKNRIGSTYLRLFCYFLTKVIERFLFPDKYISWLPFALLKAKKIFADIQIDLIFASGPPFSAFIIGSLLKRKYNVPLIIEFRDQWSLNLVYKVSKLAQLHRYFDNRIMTYADDIVFASEGFLAEYRTSFPEIDFTHAQVIRNSYDPEDFNGTYIRRQEKFVVTYAGSFYGPRSPNNFLTAIAQLRNEGRIHEDKFKFVIMGNLNPKILDHYDLSSLVEIEGCLPHAATFKQLASSTLLLVIVADGYQAQIPAKIYEYFATRKPVLVLCPVESVVRGIVERTRSGIVADVNDVCDIREKLYQLYADGDLGFNDYRIPDELLESFSCEKTTRQLEKVLSYRLAS